ncbi:MAG: DUF456 domain-containing protein [Deltaproteobacteria bacterium]|jgi:uncharacterized protein YqgC (DUF456 family)|nr:DUF456 domain-containing protein [Deltaproteobacteria bacterium]
MDYAVIAVCLLAMLIGLAGTIVPVIPSLPLIFAAFLGYGLFDHWRSYGLWTMVAVGAVVAATVVLDHLASVLGAKKMGAGRAGMVGSLVLGIIGLVFLNLPGLILGAFAGAVAFEMVFSHKELGLAMKAGWGALLGLLVGSLFKFVVGLVLTLAFAWKVFSG